jgi:DUF1707 SHOCT-like domain
MTARDEQGGRDRVCSRFDWRDAPGRARTYGASTAHLRVSDAERHEVAERLSRHFADGRLDQSEFDLRLGRATGAVTRGDLDGLFDDLPPLSDEVVRPRRRRRLIPLLFAIAIVALAAESVLSVAHVPWVLFVVVGVFLWYRFGHRDRDRHASTGVAR